MVRLVCSTRYAVVDTPVKPTVTSRLHITHTHSQLTASFVYLFHFGFRSHTKKTGKLVAPTLQRGRDGTGKRSVFHTTFTQRHNFPAALFDLGRKTAEENTIVKGARKKRPERQAANLHTRSAKIHLEHNTQSDATVSAYILVRERTVFFRGKSRTPYASEKERERESTPGNSLIQ